MMNAKRAFKSLACALALLANGAAAAAAQQQPQRDRERVRDVLVEKDRIMIQTAQGEPGTPLHGGIVIAGPGDAPSVSFSFVASEMAFDRRVVKGAPFSAEAVSETTQTLADGNRISHKKASAIYRDSEGRTRREETATGVGPFAPAGDGHKAIYINDPVSGTNYVLNPLNSTATKLSQHFVFERRGPNDPQGAGFSYSFKTGEPGQRQPDASKPIHGGVLNSRALNRVQPVYPAIARAAGAQGSVTVEVVVNEEGKVESARALDGHPLLREAAVNAARQWEFAPTKLSNQPVKVTGRISFEFTMTKGYPGAAEGAPPPPPEPGEPPAPPGVRMMRRPANAPRFEESKESLGRQTIEGVEAEGTRTTVTIPVGAIGNERPILITSERWYSPELQLVVMTRHSDPRFGETTYRLTNISRAEPDRSLFEVPSGYTVKEGGPFMRGIEPLRRPRNEQ
ncbi:MAG TPA: TonB family protein [Pyrinomonadaceae bacterium]|nr:TonB family protein [Pyrinomonadaceae bacterium]